MVVAFFGRAIIEVIQHGSEGTFLPETLTELIGGGIVIVLAGILIFIAMIIFMIIGSIRANGGQAYRYPISIRFVK
jgi:uncharacterized Tic20 family protein